MEFNKQRVITCLIGGIVAMAAVYFNSYSLAGLSILIASLRHNKP